MKAQLTQKTRDSDACLKAQCKPIWAQRL